MSFVDHWRLEVMVKYIRDSCPLNNGLSTQQRIVFFSLFFTKHPVVNNGDEGYFDTMDKLM